MNGDWLEDKLKDRFNNFNLDLDIDEAWGNLQAAREVPKKRKRRGFIIWWTGLGLFMLIAISIFIFQNQNTQNIQNIATEKRSEIIENELTPTSNSSQTDTVHSNLSIPVNEQIINPNKSQSPNQPIKTPKPIAHQIDKSIKRHASSFPTPIIQTDRTLSLNPLVSNSKMHARSTFMDSLETLTLIDILPLAYESKEVNLPALEAEKPSKMPKHAIGINIGYGIHFRQLSALNPELEPFVSRRNQSEKTLDNWGANIFYRRRLEKRLFIEGGIGVMQTTTKFQDTYSQTSSNRVDDHIYYINRFPDGTEEFIRDTATILNIENTNSTYYQRHRQLSFNVLLGGEKSIRRDLDLRFAVGAEYAIWAASKGVSFSENKLISDYSNLKKLGYKQTGILHGLARLEIAKSFANQHEISLNIEGKTNLNNVFKSNAQKEKRYHLLPKIGYVRWF